MTWRHFTLSATVALGLALLPHHTVGQQTSLKDQLVGTWHLVSQSQTLQDGSARDLYGVNPKGVNIFTADGQFVLLFMRSDLPKIAAADRVKATSDEARAVFVGSLGYFGRYTLDEPTKTLVLSIQGATFSNLVGIDQKRIISFLTTDELKYRNPGPVSGGFVEAAFKRAK
jgi:hypothetical protein